HQRAQTVGVHGAGQDVVDRHALFGHLAGNAGEERRQARAGPGGEVEAGQPGQHRVRGDVDDPAETTVRHRADDPLDQLDRRHHVLNHTVDHRFTVQLAEIAEGWAGIVVDEDI